MNFEGDTRIRTILGASLSFVMYTMIFIFAYHNFIRLVRGSDPTIDTNKIDNYFSPTKKVFWSDPLKSSWHIAFTVEHPVTGKIMDDPDYVTWVVENL